MDIISVIKRDGSREDFNPEKIRAAVTKAFSSQNYPDNKYTKRRINRIVAASTDECRINATDNILEIETIQDIVEDILMYSAPKEVAKEYIRYRDRQAVKRNLKMLNQVDGLFNHSDSYLMKENANKKAELTNVQFSYLGGILGTHYCRTQVFSEDVLDAHDKGAIHIHDIDMSAMEGITNCSLLNLEDCLYNGTVLNDVLIEPQTKFVTACTVATQIIQGVAGLQYGGITVTMSHLVKALKSNVELIHRDYPENLWEFEYKKAIRDGIQTFMYQVNSMFTTQG